MSNFPARQVLGEPDPFRVRYRDLRKGTVAKVVRGAINRLTATQFIRERAKESVPLSDQSKFVEVVENELMGLHEGNIARYGLRPSEYENWRRGW